MTQSESMIGPSAATNQRRASYALRIETGPARPSHSVLVMPGSSWPLNPNGAVHGGMVTAVATRGAVAASPGGRPSTLAVDFHRPALPPLTVESSVLSRSEALAFVAVTVRAVDGRVCATAQVSLSLDANCLAASPAPTSEEITVPLGTTAPLLPPPSEGGPDSWRHWVESLPVSRFVGLQCTAVSRAGFSAAVEHPGDSTGRVPEELVAAWADHCFGLASFIAGPPDSTPATASLATQHLAPARGPLTLETTTRKIGRTLALVHVDVRDGHQTLVAVADGTMSVDGSSRPQTKSGEDRVDQ